MLLVLGTMGSICVEHLLNVKAQEALEPRDLPQFFSAAAAASACSRSVRRRRSAPLVVNKWVGLTLAMISPSLALAAGGLGALVFPGLVP